MEVNNDINTQSKKTVSQLLQEAKEHALDASLLITEAKFKDRRCFDADEMAAALVDELRKLIYSL